MNCAIEKKNSAAYRQELTIRMGSLEWCPEQGRPVSKMFTMRKLLPGTRLRWEYKYTPKQKKEMMEEAQPDNSFTIENFIQESFVVERTR